MGGRGGWIGGGVHSHGYSASAGINTRGFSFPFQHVGRIRRTEFGGQRVNLWGNGAYFVPGLAIVGAQDPGPPMDPYDNMPPFAAPYGFGSPHYQPANPAPDSARPQQQATVTPPPPPAAVAPPPPPKPVTMDASKLDSASYDTGKSSLEGGKDAFVTRLASQMADQLKAQGIDPNTPEGKAKLAGMDFSATVMGNVSRLPFHGEKADGTKNRNLGVARGGDYTNMLTAAAESVGFTADHIHITPNKDPQKTVIPGADHQINEPKDRSSGVRSITIAPNAQLNAQANATPPQQPATGAQPATTPQTAMDPARLNAQDNAYLNFRLDNAQSSPIVSPRDPNFEIDRAGTPGYVFPGMASIRNGNPIRNAASLRAQTTDVTPPPAQVQPPVSLVPPLAPITVTPLAPPAATGQGASVAPLKAAQRVAPGPSGS